MRHKRPHTAAEPVPSRRSRSAGRQTTNRRRTGAGRLVSSDRLAELYLCELDATVRMSREEEAEMAARIEQGDEAALLQLVTAHGWLVSHFARRHRGLGLDLLDLVQEGNLGLMRAAETFDHRRGFRFATYAGWWVRQSMGRAVAKTGRVIRLPVHMRHALLRLRRTRQMFTQRHGREPETHELAALADIPLETVTALLSVATSPISLDAPLHDDGVATIEDAIEDPTAEDPEHQAMLAELQAEVREALASLPEREQQILRRRFGVGRRSSQSLQQVGDAFQLTRERIRQIESRALGRLRRGVHGERLRSLAPFYR